jgi:hypothetical protein
MGTSRAGRLSAWQVFAWWERRRLGFNGWLLGLGLPSIGLWALLERAAHGAWPASPAVTRWAWGLVLANACYCAGWALEFIGRSGPQPREITDPQLRRFLMEAGLWLAALVVVASPVLAGWRALRLVVGSP